MRKKDFQTIIQDAARLEDQTGQFFLDAVDTVHSPGAKQLLKELAAEEITHKELLESLDMRDYQEQSEVDLDDLLITEFLTAKKIAPNSTSQDILIAAMQLEKSAYDFYSGLAKGTSDSQSQQLLERLAQEELNHKVRLEREYDDAVYREN